MTKILGLIGYPLSHSFSKKYFTEKFENELIKGFIYNNYSIEKIEFLKSVIEENPTLIGLNVTIPYKQTIIPFLDELDTSAKEVGAVNCVKIKRIDAAIYTIGFNTDVIGFKQSIKPFLEFQHEKALILGTGGASKAVYYVLKNIGIDCYFVTRKKETNNSNVFTYDDLNENILNAFKLIVNTTPLGTYPNVEEYPNIPYSMISTNHLLYDLVYNPSETAFLRKGKQQGASIVNGMSMLKIQAEEAWRIWNATF